MSTQWLDAPEAAQALAALGGIEGALADPAGFLAILGEAIETTDTDRADLRGYLAERGLTVGQVVDLASDVAIAEPDAEVSDKHGRGGLASAVARQAVATLWARGFEPEMIARVLDLPLPSVRVSLARRNSTPAEREILAAHFAGAGPSEIARKLDVPHRTALDIIRRHGQTPHRDPVRNEGRILREKCVQLFNHGSGYREIMQLTGANRNQVRNALRAAAKRGECPDYGSRAVV